MSLTFNIVLFLLGGISFISFYYFASEAGKENEPRAQSLARITAFVSASFFLFSILMDNGYKFALMVTLGALSVIVVILFVIPVGNVEVGRQKPKSRVDERDIMFARGRLQPGTREYKEYYSMRPKNKESDDNTRSKPGLLSPQSLYFNPYHNPAPISSFSLTQAMKQMVEGQPHPHNVSFGLEDATKYIKGITKYFGALNVGITRLEPYHVYSHIGRGSGKYGAEIQVEHKYAVAFTVEMSHEMIANAPQSATVMESAKQYVEAGRIAVQLAESIRVLGYPARAHIDGDYRVICPLVARDAGLGEIGRVGLLMTPTHGPRVRIAVVTTDMPLIPDEYIPNTSMIDFCNLCKKCADNCPSKSISLEPLEEYDETLRWRINPDSCYEYWNVIGTDCGICIRVCPYSHPSTATHNLVRWGISRSGLFRRLALWLDNLFYGKYPGPKDPPDWANFS